MTDTIDNPPAFPRSGFEASLTDESKRDTMPQDGMMLLDFFAATALQGLLSRDSYEGGWSKEKGVKRAAQFAYEYADAMLAERARRQP